MGILLENKQEAESYLKKNNIDKTDGRYVKLKEILIKHSSYLGVFTKMVMSGNISLEQVSEILSYFDRYKNSFKLDNINPQVLLTQANKQGDRAYEYITDQIDIVKLNSLTREFISTIQHSNVRKDLKSNHFNTIKNGIISLRDTKGWKEQLEFISKKSAALKSGDDIIEVFDNLVKNAIGGFSSESISKSIKETSGAIEIYNDNGFVVAMVFSYYASKKLGSSSWCISRSESMFNSYAQGNQQLFIWDTSKSPSSNDSLLGVTLYENGRVSTSHKKNDSYFDSYNYFSKIVNIKNLERTIFQRFDKRDDRVTILGSIYNGNSVSIVTLSKYIKNEISDNKNSNPEVFIDLVSIVIRAGSEKYDFSNIFKQGKDINLPNLSFKKILNDLKDLIETSDLTKIKMSRFIPSIISTYRNSGILIFNYLFRDIKNNPTFKSLNTGDQMCYKILMSISYVNYTIYNHSAIYYFSEFDGSLDISIDKLVISEGYNNYLSNLFLLLNNIGSSELDKYLNIRVKSNEVVYDGKSYNTKFMRFITILNCDILTLDEVKGDMGLIPYKNVFNVDKLILNDSKITKGEILSFKNLNHIVKNNSTILKTELSGIKKLESLTFYKCDLDKIVSLPKNIDTLEIYYTLFNFDNIKDINVNKIICTDEVMHNLSDSDKQMLLDKNIQINSLPILTKESLDSELLTKLYKVLKDKKKINKFFNILSNIGIDISKVKDEHLKYLPSISIKNLTKSSSEKSDHIILAIDSKGNVNNIFNLRHTVYHHNSNSRKNMYKVDIKYYDENGYLFDKEQLDFNKRGKVYIKDIIEHSNILIVLDKNLLSDKKELSTFNKKGERRDSKSGSTALMSYEDHIKDLNRRKKEFIKDKFTLRYKSEKKTIDYVSFIFKKTICIDSVTRQKKYYTNILNKIIEYVSIYNQDSDDPKLNDINTYIRDTLSSLVNNKKDYYNTLLNRIYLESRGDKIYPDSSKLNEMMNHIKNIDKSLSDGLKSVSNLEYVSDISIMKYKINMFSDVINSYSVLKFINIGVNFHSLLTNKPPGIRYRESTYKSKDQSIAKMDLNNLMDYLNENLSELSKKVNTISKI